MIKSFKELRKMTKDDTFYTDYPFVFLGDEPCKEAPVRPIKLVSYDQDKYVEINVLGHITSIKAGYVYPVEVRICDKEYNRIRRMWYSERNTFRKILDSLPETTYDLVDENLKSTKE